MIILGYIGLGVLLGLSIFQILLIAGKPYGDFAWGGQHKVLPKHLRIASLSSIILYIVFALFLVSKAGIAAVITDQALLVTSMWVFSIYFTLGIFLNLISRNKKERFLMTPIVTILAIVFWIVTLN